MARVPLLDGDIHDLAGVQTVADHLFGLSGADHRSADPGAPPFLAKSRTPWTGPKLWTDQHVGGLDLLAAERNTTTSPR